MTRSATGSYPTADIPNRIDCSQSDIMIVTASTDRRPDRHEAVSGQSSCCATSADVDQSMCESASRVVPMTRNVFRLTVVVAHLTAHCQTREAQRRC